MQSKLSKLQLDFLAAFFGRENRFCLSGRAALTGFYLGHRETHDLDLFTLENDVDAGASTIAEIARQWDATVEPLQTTPDFGRLLFRRGNESIVIGLVREYVPPRIPEKPIINGIRVDPPEEILANKLCALLSRSEVRDLVDVRALELAGHKAEDALAAATAKDPGLTSAQLAWVLSQIEFGDELIVPGGVGVAELRQYVTDLIVRLTHLAYPSDLNQEEAK